MVAVGEGVRFTLHAAQVGRHLKGTPLVSPHLSRTAHLHALRADGGYLSATPRPTKGNSLANTITTTHHSNTQKAPHEPSLLPPLPTTKSKPSSTLTRRERT